MCGVLIPAEIPQTPCQVSHRLPGVGVVGAKDAAAAVGGVGVQVMGILVVAEVGQPDGEVAGPEGRDWSRWAGVGWTAE